MNKSFFLFAMLFALLFAACKPAAEESTSTAPTTDQVEESLRAANDQFYTALNAMFTGDFEPMEAVWSHSDHVTLMSPFGDRLVGWEAVGGEFRKEAGMKLGGKVVCQDLAVYAGTHLGYTLCVESGENMSADGKPVEVMFRATNIFRMEEGHWKMVHHHTDLSAPLQEAVSKME